MNGKSMPVNRHVVDQLADIRAKIKTLKKDEQSCVDEIKAMARTPAGDLDYIAGNEFIASMNESTRKGAINNESLDEFLQFHHSKTIEEFRKAPTTVLSIRLERRENEVA